MSDYPTQSTVVVGIDGSATAKETALWAVDDAISREIPLQLVHVIEGAGSAAGDTAAQMADAQRIVGDVRRAVEATDKPVKVEVDIVSGRPAATLLRMSRRAAMICVGAVGAHPYHHGQIGSTAAAVAGSAHCAVAILHGRAPAEPMSNVILVVADESPDDGILLQTAAHQAVLRAAPLRVITCWEPPRSDPAAVREGDRCIRARLGRRMARWQHQYPALRIELAAVHGDLSRYLAVHAPEFQMVIVSARGSGRVRDVAGPAGNAALRGRDCVVLIVDQRHL